MTGMSVRGLRNYVTQGLLVPIELRGTSTRYARRELVRLLALLRGRKETKLTLAEMKKKLDRFGDRELEAWLRNGPVPPAAAAALGFVQESKAKAGEAAQADMVEPWVAQLETWRYVPLLPGLELRLASSASPAAQRAAQEIWRKYAG